MRARSSGSYRHPHPFVRRLAGTFIAEKTPVRPFFIPSDPASGQPDQYASMGFIRSDLGSIALHKLKPIIAYMLEHAPPHGDASTQPRATIVTTPGNYERFEELREPDGRHILLHELLKEPDDVQRYAYQLIERVDHGRHDMPDVEIESERALLLTRPPGVSSGLTVPHLKPSRIYDMVPLVANAGYPDDDPTIYVAEPARAVKGMIDGRSNTVVDICGGEIERWMTRTENEPQRLGLPELESYRDSRFRLARRRSAICQDGTGLARTGFDRLAHGRAVTDPSPIQEADVSQLASSGWTPDQIAQVWGYVDDWANVPDHRHARTAPA